MRQKLHEMAVKADLGLYEVQARLDNPTHHNKFLWVILGELLLPSRMDLISFNTLVNGEDICRRGPASKEIVDEAGTFLAVKYGIYFGAVAGMFY